MGFSPYVCSSNSLKDAPLKLLYFKSRLFSCGLELTNPPICIRKTMRWNAKSLSTSWRDKPLVHFTFEREKQLPSSVVQEAVMEISCTLPGSLFFVHLASLDCSHKGQNVPAFIWKPFKYSLRRRLWMWWFAKNEQTEGQWPSIQQSIRMPVNSCCYLIKLTEEY